MGLFSRFKKEGKAAKTDEQIELESLIRQNHAVFADAFPGRRATDEEILRAEQQLGVKIPEPYVWFLKEYGSGGYWFEILGYCKNGRPEFVEETLRQRENGLPEGFLVIEACDEFFYCMDTTNGKIVSWDQYDKEGSISRFHNFYEFFKDEIENAVDNL